MTQVTFYPTGSGALTEILAQQPGAGYHWEKVDDPSTDDADYIYFDVQAPPIYQVYTDLFTFNPTVQGGRINFVRICRRTQAPFAQPGYSASVVRIGSTNYFSADHANTGAFGDLYDDFTVDPSTSAIWNWSNIYTMQFGVRLGNADYGYYVKCSRCYMIVDYTIDTQVEDVSGWLY